MYQDENEPEDESFLNKACDEQTRPQYYDALKERFVCHALAPEQTKVLVFIFVFDFVVAH